MLKIFGEEYFLDLDKIEECVNIPKDPSTEPSEDVVDEEESHMQHISVVKYEIIKTMIEVIMTENSEIDEMMGTKSNELSIPFKLAFNSLLNKKIITKY